MEYNDWHQLQWPDGTRSNMVTGEYTPAMSERNWDMLVALVRECFERSVLSNPARDPGEPT